jgi:hypothetical protein
MWKSFHSIKVYAGNTVEGDTTVPQTRWWNRWWLAWFVWDTVAVFEVKTDKAFRIGHRDMNGNERITTGLLNKSAKHGDFAKSEMQDNDEPLLLEAGPPPQVVQSLGRSRVLRWPHVSVLIGFEDCTFFAVDKDGNEVPLTLIRRAPRKDIRQWLDGYRLY